MAHLCQDVALAATLRAKDDLLRAARAVPADKVAWRPLGMARSTVHIVAHCAASNLIFVAAYSGTPLPYRTSDEHEAAIFSCGTLPKAEAFLNQSVIAVLDAIQSLPESRLPDLMVMPWGERVSVALGILSASYHMQYHEGQINYIQTLLGDDEYH